MAAVGHLDRLCRAAIQRDRRLRQDGRDADHELHPVSVQGAHADRGDALAWAESSAVAFANSVIGARSNREGGPSAIAAAVVGRTGRYGYHLDENRQANYVVEVRCPVKSVADFGALSYSVGKAVGSGVPWFADLAQLAAAPAR